MRYKATFILLSVILINTQLYAENFDIRTGTTIHDSEALDSYLENGHAPISDPSYWAEKEEEKSVKTKASLLYEEIRKYLNPPDSISYFKDIAGKYWEYALLADAIYDSKNNDNVKNKKEVAESGWKLDDYYQSTTNGLVVGLYKKNDKYILAIGGTTANSILAPSYDALLDIWADATLLSETIFKPNQLASLKEWYRDRRALNIIAITGHSLGGGLAQYMGLWTGIKTYTFNTAPLPLTEDSSYDLPGGIKEMHCYTKEIFDPYQNTSFYGSSKEERKLISYDHCDIIFQDNNYDKITNIMSENDPLTNILKFIQYIDGYGDLRYIQIIPSNNIALKKALFIPEDKRLTNLIVGKQIRLPIKTGHSIASIRNILQASYELTKNGLYVIADNTEGKYYVYHLPDEDINKESELLSFIIKNEPLAFLNISTKQDWVYKYILKMQEYGMKLDGDGHGNFDKNADRTQGEVLKIITQLFYNKKDLVDSSDNIHLKYFNFLKKQYGSDLYVKFYLLPDSITEETLNVPVTRGQIAEIMFNYLKIKRKIPSIITPHIDEANGWYYPSAVLREFGIATGYQSGAFGWDNKITQAESLAIFIKTYEYDLNH